MLESEASHVLSLYKGHFLAGETEEPWQLLLKNRLSGRFQRFVMRLGEHWESREFWQRAAGLYERAIELDPLAETFYRRQMVCLHAQGQRAEAIEVITSLPANTVRNTWRAANGRDRSRVQAVARAGIRATACHVIAGVPLSLASPNEIHNP